MVDVVDDEVVGGVFYLSVHFYGFAFVFSDGVVCVVCGFGEPFEYGKAGVVIGVYDSELCACQRDDSGSVVFWVGGTCGVEVFACICQGLDGPFSFAAVLLSAYKGGA